MLNYSGEKVISLDYGYDPQMLRDVRSRQAHAHREVPWPDFLRAWGELRRAEILSRDEDGNYLIREANEAT